MHFTVTAATCWHQKRLTSYNKPCHILGFWLPTRPPSLKGGAEVRTWKPNNWTTFVSAQLMQHNRWTSANAIANLPMDQLQSTKQTLADTNVQPINWCNPNFQGIFSSFSWGPIGIWDTDHVTVPSKVNKSSCGSLLHDISCLYLPSFPARFLLFTM